MAVVVITEDLIRNDVVKAREDYSGYIKITVDVSKRLVAIGGEYHADAEEILVSQFQSRSEDVWGGGYNIKLRKYETNAVLNIKPSVNDSPEILDQKIRADFLSLVKEKLSKIENFL